MGHAQSTVSRALARDIKQLIAQTRDQTKPLKKDLSLKYTVCYYSCNLLDVAKLQRSKRGEFNIQK